MVWTMTSQEHQSIHKEIASFLAHGPFFQTIQQELGRVQISVGQNEP